MYSTDVTKIWNHWNKNKNTSPNLWFLIFTEIFASGFSQQGSNQWHTSCCPAMQSKAWIYTIVAFPSSGTFPLEYLGSRMVTCGLATIWWLTENHNLCFPLQKLESALYLPRSAQCRSHLSATFFRGHHSTTEPMQLSSFIQQGKENQAQAKPFHILRNWIWAWLLVCLSSSEHGRCCPELQFGSSGTTSSGLWRKWNQNNWWVRLLDTHHLSKRHTSTLDLQSFLERVRGNPFPVNQVCWTAVWSTGVLGERYHL